MDTPLRHNPPPGTASVLLAAVVAFTVLGSWVRAESPVLAWNTALLDAVRSEATPPPLASRNLAIVHLALLDACGHADVSTTGNATARLDVLLAVTGCGVASALWPGRRGEFETIRDRLLAGFPTSPTANEWATAHQCSVSVLDSRKDDGANRSVTYIPHAEPGQWRRTAPFFRPPELPQWSAVTLFSKDSAGSFYPPGPPAPGSGAWSSALDEVRRLGGRASTERTAEQELTAKFWSDFSYTNTPPGHWNDIAASISRGRGLGERENARLFARLNVALADAAILCWKIKYTHNFWRPITAVAEESWQPLLTTPPHPEYPSGHGVFSGAAAEVLADFFGSDACHFRVRSDSMPGVERKFDSFSEAVNEISMSRVYGGIHYSFSCYDGVKLGRAIGRAIIHREKHVMTTTIMTGSATP